MHRTQHYFWSMPLQGKGQNSIFDAIPSWHDRLKRHSRVSTRVKAITPVVLHVARKWIIVQATRAVLQCFCQPVWFA